MLPQKKGFLVGKSKMQSIFLRHSHIGLQLAVHAGQNGIKNYIKLYKLTVLFELISITNLHHRRAYQFLNVRSNFGTKNAKIPIYKRNRKFISTASVNFSQRSHFWRRTEHWWNLWFIWSVMYIFFHQLPAYNNHRTMRPSLELFCSQRTSYHCFFNMASDHPAQKSGKTVVCWRKHDFRFVGLKHIYEWQTRTTVDSVIFAAVGNMLLFDQKNKTKKNMSPNLGGRHNDSKARQIKDKKTEEAMSDKRAEILFPLSITFQCKHFNIKKSMAII